MRRKVKDEDKTYNYQITKPSSTEKTVGEIRANERYGSAIHDTYGEACSPALACHADTANTARVRNSEVVAWTLLMFFLSLFRCKLFLAENQYPCLYNAHMKVL